MTLLLVVAGGVIFLLGAAFGAWWVTREIKGDDL